MLKERKMLTATAQRIREYQAHRENHGKAVYCGELADALRLPVGEIYRALEELENAGHIELVKPLLTRCA